MGPSAHSPPTLTTPVPRKLTFHPFLSPLASRTCSVQCFTRTMIQIDEIQRAPCMYLWTRNEFTHQAAKDVRQGCPSCDRDRVANERGPRKRTS